MTKKYRLTQAPVKPSDVKALLKRIRDRYRDRLQAQARRWDPTARSSCAISAAIGGTPKTGWARRDAEQYRAYRTTSLTSTFSSASTPLASPSEASRSSPRAAEHPKKTAELRPGPSPEPSISSPRLQSVYLGKGYQDEVEGGYGFCRVSRRYVDDESDDQEIVIRPIPNPDSVLYDPHCKEADWSDARGCFILDPTPLSDFKLLYPDARITDFGADEREIYRDWIGEKTVLRAEYWEVESQVRKNKSGTREIEFKRLMHYITNGVEILDRSEQPGKESPNQRHSSKLGTVCGRR